MLGFNGGLIGQTRTTTLGPSVTGVWTAREQLEAYRNQKWPGSSPVVTNGLVQYLDAGITESYPGTGTVWDDISTGGNFGLINGATFSNAFGGLFNFDGGNDWVTSTLPALSSFSVNVWVRLEVPPGERRIISTNGDQFGLATSGDKVFVWNGSVNNILSTIAANTWYNIAVTSESGSTRISINGSLDSSFTTGRAINSGSTVIGAFTSFDRRWDGDIAIVCVYNRVLTTAEITQNYNAEKSRFGY